MSKTIAIHIPFHRMTPLSPLPNENTSTYTSFILNASIYSKYSVCVFKMDAQSNNIMSVLEHGHFWGPSSMVLEYTSLWDTQKNKM